MNLATVDCRDVFDWDVLNWSRALDLWEGATGASLAGREALEIGARNGGVSLYLALKDCRVVCSDVNEVELEARKLHERHGVAPLVSYRQVDAMRMPYSDETFDIVAFKSVLGSIGHWYRLEGQKQAMKEIHRVLKPGGLLLFAENLEASPLHMWLRRHRASWSQSWRFVTIAEMKESLALFSSFEYRTFGFLAAFAPWETAKRLLHYPDRWLNPCLAESWRYLVYGCARK